jgi:hypothetical protein
VLNMPKLANPLTDTGIKALRPKPNRYFVTDGAVRGLSLEVMTSGAKVFRYRYTLNGNQQPLITVGDYANTPLQLARERARRYGEIVARGVSPVADAKRDRGTFKSLNTVKEFGSYWLQEEINNKSDQCRKITTRILEKDVYPAIGNKDLNEVTRGDVLAICDRIKKRGAPQMALVTRNTVKRLYDYAIARQVATANPGGVLVKWSLFVTMAAKSSAAFAIVPTLLKV